MYQHYETTEGYLPLESK